MSDLSKFRFLFFSFIFIFLVGTPIILAQPPSQEPQETGISIEYSKFSAIPQNMDHQFFFHTINTTDLLSNETTGCDFDLYREQGHLLFQKDDLNFNDPNEWEVNVLSGNFTKLGEYSFIISCNSSVQAGFTSAGFDVTANGKPFQAFPNQFFLIILGLGFIFISFLHPRLTLFKYLGAIFTMVMGVLTIYPGYNFINHSTLTGLGLGILLIGIGFYYLIDEAFSRDEQSKKYDQYHEEELNEAEEDLFE